MRAGWFVASSVVTGLIAVVTGGCGPDYLVRKHSPSLVDFQLYCSREEAFDFALEFAQRSNLRVAVLERSSGFIRFEMAHLEADYLDRYCKFPLEDASGAPLATYAEWIANYEGRAEGEVLLTVLLSTRSDSETNVNIRGNWSATISRDDEVHTYQVASTNVLEDELRYALVTNTACEPKRAWTVEERMLQLKSLLDEGLIDSDDYKTRRDEILAGG